jgi:hypothetical protein
MQKVINHQIDATITRIQRQSGKTIDAGAATLLIDSLQYVKIK